MNLGETIKKLRESNGWSQQEVATKIPMNQSNYSKIERGAQDPSIYQLRQLCIIFDISADELLGFSPENRKILQDISFAQKVKELYKSIYIK